MTTLAFSLFAALLPKLSDVNRGAPPDSRPADGDAWQRALGSAAVGAQPMPTRIAEAGYLMALANLGTTPSAVAGPSALQALAPRGGPAGMPVPASASEQAAATGPAPAPDATASRPSHLATGARAHSTGELSERDTPAVVARRAVVGRLALPATAGCAGSHASAQTTPEHGTTSVLVETVSASRPSPVQAIAGYTQSIAAAGASSVSEAGASFTLTTPASSLPVRVHVQWRDRVADVWIGLHRRAFDQLPDIRAGIEDWVDARGGALGQVVCNGETLSGVPSPYFTPGAF